MNTSRREFLGAAALLGAPLGAAPQLPTRVLGKTGVRVSILAFGTGSRFLLYKEEDKAIEAVRKALDLGVTYIDTADDYGKDRLSEQRVGAALQGRRKGVFVATKLSSRDGAAAVKSVEASLKALRMDRLDLIHIHSLTTPEDLAKIEEKGGVLEQLLKLRDQKMTRFIGITSHTDPAVLQTALERHDFDCTQMALNAARTGMINGGKGRGMVPNPAIKTSFETLALPVAVRKKMGVIAMKVFAQDALSTDATADRLLSYALSLPITSAVVGMPKLEQIEDNARIVAAFKPLSKTQMENLSAPLMKKHKASLDTFFTGHRDA